MVGTLASWLAASDSVTDTTVISDTLPSFEKVSVLDSTETPELTVDTVVITGSFILIISTSSVFNPASNTISVSDVIAAVDVAPMVFIFSIISSACFSIVSTVSVVISPSIAAVLPIITVSFSIGSGVTDSGNESKDLVVSLNGLKDLETDS